MGRNATLSDMVTYRLPMYTPMGWSPTASIDFTTKGYYHYPPASRFDVSPLIHHVARWWNPSRTLSISPVTTKLSLPYKSTNCATNLYISPEARTVAPIIYCTLATIPHHL